MRNSIAPAKPNHHPDADPRSTIIRACEQLEDEAYDAMHGERPLTEHELGYFRGQKKTAKSLRNLSAEAFRLAAEHRGKYGD